MKYFSISSISTLSKRIDVLNYPEKKMPNVLTLTVTQCQERTSVEMPLQGSLEWQQTKEEITSRERARGKHSHEEINSFMFIIFSIFHKRTAINFLSFSGGLARVRSCISRSSLYDVTVESIIYFNRYTSHLVIYAAFLCIFYW